VTFILPARLSQLWTIALLKTTVLPCLSMVLLDVFEQDSVCLLLS
jgi:hypothetical protein